MTWAPSSSDGGGGTERDGNIWCTWRRRATPTEMPFLACIARLYLGIEATSCQSERNFSALAHLIGDLRSNMLAYKVERMMFIRLNRHLVDEVRALDAAVEQARARVARSAQKSAAAQAERSNVCRLTCRFRCHEWTCGCLWYFLHRLTFCLFSFLLLCVDS